MKLDDLTPKQRVKTEKWIQLIKECQASGLSNEEWCNQNGVSTKQYYYYLAKIRKMAIVEIPYKNSPAVIENNDNEIIEISPGRSVSAQDSAVTVYWNHSKIEIAPDCPKWLAELILEKSC